MTVSQPFLYHFLPMKNDDLSNLATGLMKKTFKNKRVQSVPELRQMCLDLGVNMVGCQMTMDVFGFTKEEFIDGVDIGGAASSLNFAANADIQLFV